jgi:hypothetical protein
VSVSAVEAASVAGLDTGDLDLSAVSLNVMPVWMSSALGSGVAAMTLGDRIFITSNRYEQVISGDDPVLLLHELVHVGQWRREGNVGFTVRYMSDYLRNRLIGLDHKIAYRAIGFEAAAFETSERPEREVV